MTGGCCSGSFSRRLEKVRSWRGGAMGEWRKWRRAGPTMQACVLSAASTPSPAIPTAEFAQGFFRGMKAGRKLPANRFKEKSISHAERCTVFPYGVYPKKATSLMVVLEGGRVLCSRIIHFVTYQLLTVCYQLVSGPTLGPAWRGCCFWVASLSDILHYFCKSGWGSWLFLEALRNLRALPQVLRR